ncbi:MAG: TonB-dependent receptor plug domain-containing protein, partial [Fibrobacteria bacterium]
ETDKLPTPAELKKMSLEELMDLQVTLVSKQPERLAQAPSAVQVITADDIRRSGAQTIPEALRLASNLQVAQIDARQWAISSRGMNNALSNKLLVMIDGRSIYTPLYAGVFWDAQNLMMDNIERIEVVSGPGGTLWGANAVNGVINIVTKGAEFTQGGVIGGGVGTSLRDVQGARYGGKLGAKAYYRVWGRHQDFNATETLDGGDGKSSWDFSQAGMRMDYLRSASDRLSLSGNLSMGNYETQETRTDGQYALARWIRTLPSKTDFTVQAYYDHQYRSIPGVFGEDLHTFDLDVHHHFLMGARQSLIWGTGYRAMFDEVSNSQGVAFLPAAKTLQLFNAFVEDEFTILPERLKLTLGTKLEHNDYTGWEVLPSGRAAFTPGALGTFWGSIARAVRTPSRFDRDIHINDPPVRPGDPRLEGEPGFRSEVLSAYELGYRCAPRENVTVNLATFYNVYEDLRLIERNASDTLLYTEVNGVEGEIRGVEVSAGIQATAWLQIQGGYTTLDEEFRVQAGHTASQMVGSQGNDPEHQLNLRVNMDLPHGFQLNGSGRYVSELPAPAVPYYATFDLMGAWIYGGFQISLVGKNLAERRHQEFANGASAQAIPRSFLGRASWRF